MWVIARGGNATALLCGRGYVGVACNGMALMSGARCVIALWCCQFQRVAMRLKRWDSLGWQGTWHLAQHGATRYRCLGCVAYAMRGVCLCAILVYTATPLRRAGSQHGGPQKSSGRENGQRVWVLAPKQRVSHLLAVTMADPRSTSLCACTRVALALGASRRCAAAQARPHDGDQPLMCARVGGPVGPRPLTFRSGSCVRDNRCTSPRNEQGYPS